MGPTESTIGSGATQAPQCAVVMLDGDGVIRLASVEVLELFGWHPRELIGQPVEWLVPPPLRTQRVSQWHEWAADVLAGETPVAWEIVGLCRDGSEFPIEVSVIAAGGTDHSHFTVVIRDLRGRTRRRRDGRALRRDPGEAAPRDRVELWREH